MNAAQTSHFANFPASRSDQKAKAVADKTVATKARTKTRKPGAKKRASQVPSTVDEMLCYECLQQAEICREQAQEAARMKRFKAARGLFATAIALCQRALNACADRKKDNGVAASASISEPETNENAHAGAIKADDVAIEAYLQQLNIEMATYSDLARSMERPLRS